LKRRRRRGSGKRTSSKGHRRGRGGGEKESFFCLSLVLQKSLTPSQKSKERNILTLSEGKKRTTLLA
jgi:hypothetical protein